MQGNLQKIPLTQSQMGIYIECMQHPNEIIYHMPFLYKLGKEIDLFRLRDAFYKVITQRQKNVNINKKHK